MNGAKIGGGAVRAVGARETMLAAMETVDDLLKAACLGEAPSCLVSNAGGFVLETSIRVVNWCGKGQFVEASRKVDTADFWLAVSPHAAGSMDVGVGGVNKASFDAAGKATPLLGGVLAV